MITVHPQDYRPILLLTVETTNLLSVAVDLPDLSISHSAHITWDLL